MKLSRLVFYMSGLCIAVLLGWYLRGAYDDSAKRNGAVPRQAGRDLEAKTEVPIRPLPASGSGPTAPSDNRPFDMPPPSLTLPGAQPVDAEIDPTTGAVRLTRSEHGAAPPSPFQTMPADAPHTDIEIDPATGAVRHVLPPTAAPQSPAPPAVKTQNENARSSPPTTKKIE